MAEFLGGKSFDDMNIMECAEMALKICIQVQRPLSEYYDRWDVPGVEDPEVRCIGSHLVPHRRKKAIKKA